MSDGIFYGDEAALIDASGTIAKHVANNIRWDRFPFDTTTRRRCFHGHEMPLFDRQSIYAHQSPFPDVPAPRLGELILPTGCARYGRALLAFGRSSIVEIAKQAFDFTPGADDSYGGYQPEDDPIQAERWGTQHNPLDLIYRYNGVTITREMYALTPHSIDTPDGQGLWLLPLVDIRYFWQHTLRARDMELLDEEEWDDTFSKLGDQLDPSFGLTIDHETVAEEYVIPDREYLLTEGLSAADAMDVAALSAGFRPVFDGVDTIELQSVDQAKSRHTTNLALPNIRAGANVPRHSLSQELTLIVRKLHNHFTNLDEPYYVDAELKTEHEALYDYPASGSDHPTVIWSTMWADFQNDEITSESQAKLDALAERIAIDLKEWSQNYHVTVIAGLANWTLSGFDDYLSISPHDTSNGFALLTTIRSFPPDFMPRMQISQVRDLFTHSKHGLVFLTTQEIPAATEDEGGNKLPGYGTVKAYDHNRETGATKERHDSAGNWVEVLAYNFDPDDPVGADRIVQAKQWDTLAIIDVEYCG